MDMDKQTAEDLDKVSCTYTRKAHIIDRMQFDAIPHRKTRDIDSARFSTRELDLPDRTLHPDSVLNVD